MNIWILGILVFLFRIDDVSVGKLRTIHIVQGRTEKWPKFMLYQIEKPFPHLLRLLKRLSPMLFISPSKLGLFAKKGDDDSFNGMESCSEKEVIVENVGLTAEKESISSVFL